VKAVPVWSDDADLQRKLMNEVARALQECAAEMCMRSPYLVSGAARLVLVEGVIVSLLAYIAMHGNENDLKSRAVRLAEQAIKAIAEGRVENATAPRKENGS
jgi:hypothetical protein